MPEPRPAASVRSASSARSALAQKRRAPGKPAGMHAIPDLVLDQPAGDQRLLPKRLRGRSTLAEQLGKRHGAVEIDQRSSRSRPSSSISSSKGTIGWRGGGSVAGSVGGVSHPSRTPRSKNLFCSRRGGTISTTMRLRSVITTVSPEAARRTNSLRGWARIQTKGCITVLRPSRRALWALLRMRLRLLMALREYLILRRLRKRPSRRTHGADPA